MKTPNRPSTFLLCLRNDSEDLEPRKLYEVLPDAAAASEGYVRVIDESGEDYLYPLEYFAAVDLPSSVKRRLRATAALADAPVETDRKKPKTSRRAHG